MPARRKPFNVLEDTGAFRKDPQRRSSRINEATDDRQLGDPPDYFDEAHCAAWYELAAEAPTGLRQSDRAHLELTVRLLLRTRTDVERSKRSIGNCMNFLVLKGKVTPKESREFQKEMLKAIMPTAGDGRLLLKCFEDMYMTPGSRGRLT